MAQAARTGHAGADVVRRARRRVVLGGPVPRRPRVSVVIPALNEAANLPHVLTRVPGWVDEVVLVDGHSVDDTVGVARALWPGVRVVVQDGRGKGNALACGFAAVAGPRSVRTVNTHSTATSGRTVASDRSANNVPLSAQ